MKKLGVFLMVFALLSMFTVTAFAADLSVTVSQDCYTRQDGSSATTNYNMDPGDPTNKAKSVVDIRFKPSDSKNRNAYLEFDVKGIQGASVDSVKLTLTSSKMGGNTTFDVYPVTGAWDEKNVTWNTNPKYDESKKLGSYTSSSDLMSGQQVTVTLDKSFFKGDGKYSIVLIPTGPSNNDDSEFYSKENDASKASKLTITYSGTPTTSPAQTSSATNPKTGDAGIVLAVAGLLSSGFGTIYVLRKRK